MTITHPEMVRKLAKTGTQHLAGLTASSAHNLHMAVGISGEVAELIEVLATPAENNDLLEEFGDVEFYMSGLRAGTGCKYTEPLPHNVGGKVRGIDTLSRDAAVAAGNVLDVVKKEAIYEKPLDFHECQIQMAILDQALGELYQWRGIRRETALVANMEKLAKRYGDDFEYSNEAAQQRADKPADENQYGTQAG